MISIVAYSSSSEEIRHVRNTVFTKEQGILETIDFDGLDPECYHVLTRDDKGNPIGTGRMQKDGHIGRLAVLPHCRGKHIGKSMLEELINYAGKIGLEQVYLNSQDHAIGFYEKLGFSCEGETFLEADIPHIKMVKNLTTHV